MRARRQGRVTRNEGGLSGETTTRTVADRLQWMGAGSPCTTRPVSDGLTAVGCHGQPNAEPFNPSRRGKSIRYSRLRCKRQASAGNAQQRRTAQRRRPLGRGSRNLTLQCAYWRWLYRTVGSPRFLISLRFLSTLQVCAAACLCEGPHGVSSSHVHQGWEPWLTATFYYPKLVPQSLSNRYN